MISWFSWFSWFPWFLRMLRILFRDFPLIQVWANRVASLFEKCGRYTWKVRVYWIRKHNFLSFHQLINKKLKHFLFLYHKRSKKSLKDNPRASAQFQNADGSALQWFISQKTGKHLKSFWGSVLWYHVTCSLYKKEKQQRMFRGLTMASFLGFQIT